MFANLLIPYIAVIMNSVSFKVPKGYIIVMQDTVQYVSEVTLTVRITFGFYFMALNVHHYLHDS